jgi:hypothetical protein
MKYIWDTLYEIFKPQWTTAAVCSRDIVLIDTCGPTASFSIYGSVLEEEGKIHLQGINKH